MATTQRITPTTTPISSATVSNDKIKKGAMYGGAGITIAAALAGAARFIHTLVTAQPADDPVTPPIEGEDNVAENAEHTDVVQTVQPIQPEPAPAPIPTPVHPEPTPAPSPVHPEPTPINQDPDIDAIAQEIIAKEEVDVADIDIAPFIQFDNLGVYYDPMGNEYQAAIFHLKTGEQFKLVDLNHDGLFTEIFDLAGGYIGSVDDLDFPPFYFTEDDIRFALENEIGYVGPAAEPGDSTMDLETAAAGDQDVAQNAPASSTATEPVDVVDDIDTSDVDVQAIISAILESPVETKDEVVIEADDVDPLYGLDPDWEIANSDDTELDDCSDTDILNS